MRRGGPSSVVTGGREKVGAITVGRVQAVEDCGKLNPCGNFRAPGSDLMSDGNKRLVCVL